MREPFIGPQRRPAGGRILLDDIQRILDSRHLAVLNVRFRLARCLVRSAAVRALTANAEQFLWRSFQRYTQDAAELPCNRFRSWRRASFNASLLQDSSLPTLRYHSPKANVCSTLACRCKESDVVLTQFLCCWTWTFTPSINLAVSSSQCTVALSSAWRKWSWRHTNE